MASFELQIHSAIYGGTQHWALYAIPCSREARIEPEGTRNLRAMDRAIAALLQRNPPPEVERTACRSIAELDRLFGKLKLIGMSPRVLEMARVELVEKNISRVLGTLELSQAERSLLGLQLVPGLTEADLKQMLFDNNEEIS